MTAPDRDGARPPRIAVYGGSFDPPHLGHVRAAEAAVKCLRPDKLFFIPAANPPHKELDAASPPPEARLHMTRLAAREVPGAAVLDMEMRRGGVSYTSDTLRELAEAFPGSEIFFLMGSDMLRTFDHWHEFRRILSLATLAVFGRERGENRKLLEVCAHLEAVYDAKTVLVPLEPVQVSSSQIRALLPERRGADMLPESVYAYIIRRRLFGARPDLTWLRDKSEQFLKPSRVPHVRGCAQEAVKLARRWGADEGEAAEAGILHDITKKLDREQQLLLCGKYDIILCNAERENEKLLHSRTGAALSRELFGVDDAVYSAIRWHTTGRPDMSLLEKIIYMADYIEPTRDFDGLARLRALAYENLDAAMALGLSMSLEEVRGRGTEPHADSVRALAWFIKSEGMAEYEAGQQQRQQ